MSSPIAIFSLSGFTTPFGDNLRAGLSTVALVKEARSIAEAIETLDAPAKPRAVIISDSEILERTSRTLLTEVVQYARAGGKVIFAEYFSSFVRPLELAAMFRDHFNLPWTTGTYQRVDFKLNPQFSGFPTQGLDDVYSMKALRLKGVSKEASMYLSIPEWTGEVVEAGIVFQSFGQGYVGYVGDVNHEEASSKAIVEMCRRAPAKSTGTSSSAKTKKPSIIVLSLLKERYLDELHSHLMNALRASAQVTTIDSPKAIIRQLESQPPDAVLAIDSGITQTAKFGNVLRHLIDYTKGGGTVICCLNFANHWSYDKAATFCQKWGLPWDAGTYCRTTVHLNKDVQNVSVNGLAPSYSVKSLSLANVSPHQCVYNPSSTSRVESHVFPPDAFPIDSKETHAAFAPVGQGYFGYVGDVNADAETSKIILAMCRLPVSSLSPDKRKPSTGFTVTPVENKSGAQVPLQPGSVAVFSDAIRQAGRNIQTGCSLGKNPLPPSTTKTSTGSNTALAGRSKFSPSKDNNVPAAALDAQKAKFSKPRPRRPREAEVEVRRAKRALKAAEKAAAGEQFKQLGNEAFKRQDWTLAVECYENAAAIHHGGQAVYYSNMAAALLKLHEYEEAETVADLALRKDPKNVKARYRRGQARLAQGSALSAITDFQTCLELEPRNEDVRRALVGRDLPPRQPKGNDDGESLFAEDDDCPRPDDPPEEDEDDSDSSDCEHEGNGVPCRSYNYEGCKAGKQCQFSHAPTSGSVRDELGRNVCKSYLLDRCKYGQTKCVYSHSKEYLPIEGWWADAVTLHFVRECYAIEEQKKAEAKFKAQHRKREHYTPSYRR